MSVIIGNGIFRAVVTKSIFKRKTLMRLPPLQTSATITGASYGLTTISRTRFGFLIRRAPVFTLRIVQDVSGQLQTTGTTLR